MKTTKFIAPLVNVNHGAKIRMPRVQIIPSGGDVKFHCGHCDSLAFRLHVAPPGIGSERVLPKITHVVCTGCARRWRVNDAGEVDAAGKIGTKKRGQKGASYAS